MNKRRCTELKKKGKWKREQCGICTRYNKCQARLDYDYKHDARRDMLVEANMDAAGEVRDFDDCENDHIGKI